MFGGQVSAVSSAEFALSPVSWDLSREYRVSFAPDEDANPSDEFRLRDGDLVRVFGYLESGQLEAYLIDIYDREEERWWNWYWRFGP